MSFSYQLPNEYRVSFTKSYIGPTPSSSINIVITKVESLSITPPASNTPPVSKTFNIIIPNDLTFNGTKESILGVSFKLTVANKEDSFNLTIEDGIKNATLPSNVLSATLPLSMKTLEFSVGTLISAVAYRGLPNTSYNLENVKINKNELIEDGDILEERHMNNIRFANRSATIPSVDLIIGEGITKAIISLSNLNNVITFVPINVTIPNTMKDLTYINGLNIKCSENVALKSLTINTSTASNTQTVLDKPGVVSKKQLFDYLKYDSTGCLVNFGEGITGISEIYTINTNLKLTLKTVPKSFSTPSNFQEWLTIYNAFFSK